jgi:hypothetical protein
MRRKLLFLAVTALTLATPTFAEDALPEPTAPAARAAALISGRFQIFMSAIAARDTFLVDTWTGRVWQLVENKKGLLLRQEMVKE